VLGAAWFGDGSAPARARVSGRDVPLADALDTAARLLTGAARPLVYLAPDISCEAQREGVALADALRATLDSVTSATALISVLAAQEQGRAAATLGEIRNRADVVVFWGVDPASRYPRYPARYAPEPAGLHVPDGRRSRRVIAVDVGHSRGPADADVRITVNPDDEVAVLRLIAERATGERGNMGPAGLGSEPLAVARARELAPELLRGRYVALVADAEPCTDGLRDSGRSAALITLAQALNASTRCALSVLRGGGNRSGADAAMTSGTGYPVAVDFARGYPRYQPYDGTATAGLSRQDFDIVTIIGAPASMPADLLPAMRHVPCAVLGPRASESAFASAHVVIDSGTAGIHESGTALRMDDVPLPLRAALEGPPGAADLVRALRARLAPSTR